MGFGTNKAWFVGLAGAFLFTAVALSPGWVWLSRPLLVAAVGFALLALFFWFRGRSVK
jgi:hypothetical protein